MNRIKGLIFTIAYLIMVTATGCGKNEDINDGSLYHIYYLGSERTDLVSKDYTIDSMDDIEIVKRLLTLMDLNASGIKLVVNNTDLTEDVLTVDFSDAYKELSVADRVLINKAVVLTLTQAPGVNSIIITVDGNGITDKDGNEVGKLNEADFLVSSRDNIIPSEMINITLYFYDKSGNGLVAVERNIEAAMGVSVERMIIEALIAGPVKGEKCVKTINSKTVVNSVITIDNVCYIDFSDDFLDSPNDISKELMIYSIVNTLTKQDDITEVIISVNGNTNAGFLADYSDNFYYNYSIIK